MDIIKMITDKVKEIETNGTLDSIIEKHTISWIDDIVRDSFTWSGVAKKSIEEALKGMLEINLDKVSLDRYQKIVSTTVEQRVNDTVIKDLSNEIKNCVDGITKPLNQKEWNLSEIISKFVDSLDKSYDGEMDGIYGECTLIVEESGSFTHIYFDKEQKDRKYSCKNQIDLNNGKIYHAKADDRNFSPFLIDAHSEFEEFLFKLYCNNVTVVIDEDECELEYTREDGDY
jgi:hypothetical protein